MVKGSLTACLALAAGIVGASTDAEPYAFDRWYAGGAAALVLPQGGARMTRVGGATARVGYYLTEALAVEGAAGWMENKAGLSAKAIGHLQGWEFWGKLFGYERLDPFVSLGVRGWMNHGSVGPACGLGTLYHLTDRWALRVDADATLALAGEVAAVYTLTTGIQYSF